MPRVRVVDDSIMSWDFSELDDESQKGVEVTDQELLMLQTCRDYYEDGQELMKAIYERSQVCRPQ